MNFKVAAALGLAVFVSACAGEHKKPAPASSAGPDQSQSSVAPGSDADLAATAGDRIFFGFDRNGLSPEAQSTLQRQAQWLKKYSDVNVQIVGNCDDRGTEEYNIALGARRATAASDYLVAKGVPASRVSTISYGKNRPVALGDNEEAWSQNRNAITAVK